MRGREEGPQQQKGAHVRQGIVPTLAIALSLGLTLGTFGYAQYSRVRLAGSCSRGKYAGMCSETYQGCCVFGTLIPLGISSTVDLMWCAGSRKHAVVGGQGTCGPTLTITLWRRTPEPLV